MNLDFSAICLDNNKISLTCGLYNEPHRYYHGVSHLEKMLRLATTSKLAQRGNEELFLKLLVAIIYHDAIYKVGSKTNESDSVTLFVKHHGIHFDIMNAIESTRLHYLDYNHRYYKEAVIQHHPHIHMVEDLTKELIRLDLYDLLHPDKLTIHNNIKQLYKEQQCSLLCSQTSFTTFIENNIKWIRTYDKQLPKESIDQYIDIVNNMKLGI